MKKDTHHKKGNREGYHFGGVKKRKEKKQKTAIEATPLVHPGSILIPGIMHNRKISGHAASMQSLGRCDNSDDGSISNDRSNYEIDDSAFMERGILDRVDEESGCEEEINGTGPGWKWDRWQDIAEDEDIPGPEAINPYNGPHGLRPSITSSFTT
eukprot:8027875-Ditylum_brightwellii.AAC.1